MNSIGIEGHVDSYLVARDGTMTLVDSDHNTLTYACADAAARLFAGDNLARPSKIGFIVALGNAGSSYFTYKEGERGKTTQDDIVSSVLGSPLKVVDVSTDPNPGTSGSVGYVVENTSTGAQYSGITVDTTSYTGASNLVVNLEVVSDDSIATTKAKAKWTSTDASVYSNTSYTSITTSLVSLGLGLNIKASGEVPEGNYRIYLKPYESNSVNIKAMLTGSDQVWVYGMLLKGEDDRIIAVKPIATPVVKNATFAFAVNWSITFK